MKRSDIVYLIKRSIEPYISEDYKPEIAYEVANTVLDNIEKCGMLPKPYVNPKAVVEFEDTLNSKGETWMLIEYIDKYPEDRGRPYPFYIEGWEKE